MRFLIFALLLLIALATALAVPNDTEGFTWDVTTFSATDRNLSLTPPEPITGNESGGTNFKSCGTMSYLPANYAIMINGDRACHELPGEVLALWNRRGCMVYTYNKPGCNVEDGLTGVFWGEGYRNSFWAKGTKWYDARSYI